MLILSIDIGIKNFAICLIKFENNNYSIVEWDVLDLSGIPNYICSNVDCNNKAKYFKNENYYCLKHAKKSTYQLPDKSMKPNYIKKRKLNELLEYTKKLNILTSDKPKKDELFKLLDEYIKDKYLCSIENKSCEYMDLISIGRNMMQQFDEKFKNYNIDKVIIENQIGPLAIRMKTLQGMTTQYFIMTSNCDIHFISSQNKLKDFINQKDITYRERKKLGIEICQNIFKETSTIEYFNKHKKKDDLADSFLQGLWYIKQNYDKECIFKNI